MTRFVSFDLVQILSDKTHLSLWQTDRGTTFLLYRLLPGIPPTYFELSITDYAELGRLLREGLLLGLPETGYVGSKNIHLRPFAPGTREALLAAKEGV